MKKILSLTLLWLLSVVLPHTSSESVPAYTLAGNFQQGVSSTALNWVTAEKDFKNYDDAVVGAYESDEVDDSNKKPLFVCRAPVAGAWVAGNLRSSDKKCVVSFYGQVHHMQDYQILVNIEQTARLTWVVRDKYIQEPQGTVIGAEEPFRNYVGRKKLSEDSKWTHVLGYLDPNKNFGKYTFVTAKDEQIESEDGEVLVETEPYSYELRDIKYHDGNKPQPTKKLVLGTAILKNDESDGTAKVDSVIPYNHSYSASWGHGHGLITGLPLRVYQKNRSPKDLQWGVTYQAETQEVHQIEYVLEPGTAVNVTLRAKYVDADVPYSAKLLSVYREGENKEQIIKDNLREAMLRDITAEYSPVYFLHNNSLVPTTTTTTTTTTSTTTTTTTRKTTTITETLPIDAPDLEETLKPKIVDKDMASKENEVMSDDGDAVSSLTKKDDASESVSASNYLSKALVLSTLLLIILRLT